MKILGLDLGSKTLGIAISDALGFTAQGIETFKFPENHYTLALNRIKELIDKDNIKKIVLGYPKNMNGTVGERGKICENFADKIKTQFNVEVVLWDERLTTVEAERVLINANMSRDKRKKIIDKMAAVVLLQSYLNSN